MLCGYKIEANVQWLVIKLHFRSPSLHSFCHLPDMVGGLGASSAMLSPVVQTVLQMGFEASLVESLVQTKYLLTGQHYTSVSDLVTDVLQAEEEDRQRGPQNRGNSQCLDLATPPQFRVIYCTSYSTAFVFQLVTFQFNIFLQSVHIVSL